MRPVALHRLGPGDRLPLTQGRFATVVGRRRIEDIDHGSFMICLRTGDLVQADGWDAAGGCYVIDLMPGRRAYGCASPGEEFVLVTLS
jgi:hypothetical protein